MKVFVIACCIMLFDGRWSPETIIIDKKYSIYSLSHRKKNLKKKREINTNLDPSAVCDEFKPGCRKSSSISKTLANNDFDERSFNSNSFIL